MGEHHHHLYDFLSWISNQIRTLIPESRTICTLCVSYSIHNTAIFAPVAKPIRGKPDIHSCREPNSRMGLHTCACEESSEYSSPTTYVSFFRDVRTTTLVAPKCFL